MKNISILLYVMIALLTASCSTLKTTPFSSPMIEPTQLLISTSNITITVAPSPQTSQIPGPPVKTSVPTQNYDATTTAIVESVAAASNPGILSSHQSPDGQWQADIVTYECVQVQLNAGENAYERLVLIRSDTGAETTVDGQLQYCEGLGAFGLWGLSWSPDSQYYYYTHAREGLPDGLCGYWERPVHRVNTLTKNPEFVGSGPMSPDKTKLAFWEGSEIVIWSLDEGEVSRVPSLNPNAFKNTLAWSPDSQAIAYMQTESECYPFGKSYISMLDLSGLDQTLLLESETPNFSGLVWDAPGHITLVDLDGKKWIYNLVSKDLSLEP